MAEFEIKANLRVYLDKLKGPDFENNIPYMYVDTQGKVTVGVGHNLTAHGDLAKYAFYVKRFERKAVIGGDKGDPIGKPQTVGRMANAFERLNDYNFLTKHKGLGKFSPENLAPYTTVEMNSADINALFNTDLQKAISVARTEFTPAAFDAYPVSCQAALIDIAFNCGSFGTFINFKQAIKGQGAYAGKSWADRWKAAATESRRPQVKEARNTAIKQWLNDGAAAK